MGAMLKVRIIPTLLFKDHGLVKGVGFDSWRRVGTALPAIKVYNTREVDELVFLDISANRENRSLDFTEVDRLADECFMPLTVGGGIRSTEDIKKALRAGADKVAINSAAIERPELIREGAYAFGAQCIVLSIDVRKTANGYRVFSHSGTHDTGLDAVEWAKRAESLGAGEILLTSIERDGTQEGYDLDLLRSVTAAVTIPVIAAGGAGCYEDMAKALKEGCSAVAAASMFHFTQQTPLEAKRYLAERGFPARS
jgi:cyclase